MTLLYVPYSYGLLLPPSDRLANISKKTWYLIGTAFQIVQQRQSDLVIKSLTYAVELLIPDHFFVPIDRKPTTRRACSPLKFEVVALLNQIYGQHIQFESDINKDQLLARIGSSVSLTKERKHTIIRRISKDKQYHSSLLQIFEKEEEKFSRLLLESKEYSKEIEEMVTPSLLEWFEILQEFGGKHD